MGKQVKYLAKSNGYMLAKSNGKISQIVSLKLKVKMNDLTGEIVS